MTYAFAFDESACTGCKACQVACKDKNNLSTGILWRRIYEVTGGGWTQTGEAWRTSVFAYHLSIACNHCVHPKCAGVCPVDAYNVRPDGIVLINAKECIGCGYCAWACPYDSPQMDKNSGIITKCNLCYDNLDKGLPPACVAACPMRCLDLVDANDLELDEKGLALWKIPGEEHPFPLPSLSRTEPHLLIIPHPGVKLVGEDTHVGNREEISPNQLKEPTRSEIPLIWFTLFAQMAIGSYLAIFLIYFGSTGKQIFEKMTIIPLIAVGVEILIAMLVSLIHLKTPMKSYRALKHFRKSWLSREILFTAGFAGLLGILVLLMIFNIGPPYIRFGFSIFTGICALTALYCMQRVYQLRSIPAWNSALTLLEFGLSTIGLGCMVTAILLPAGTSYFDIRRVILAGIISFLAAIPVTLFSANSSNKKLSLWRVGLLLAVFLSAVIVLILPATLGMGSLILVFAIAFAQEIIGRWIFYSRRVPGI